MKLLITNALIFVTTFCFAQQHTVYFLKNNGLYVQERDSADYERIVSQPDSGSVLYNVFEFYLNGKSKLRGKSSAIDPPKFEGSRVTFYTNGKKQNIATYIKGNIIGNEYEFYPNGKLYLEKKHPDIVTADYDSENYSIIAENDSSGTSLIVDGNGYYEGFDNKFKKIVEEGLVKDGKKDGAWKGLDEVLNLSFSEIYERGKFISGFSIDEKGDTTRYNERQVEPQYKGGKEAFYKFLVRKVHYPDYEKENNIQGSVIVSFVVEKDGKLTNIKIVKNASHGLDMEALRVVRLSQNWIPGTEYGKPVRVQFSIPINFGLTD